MCTGGPGRKFLLLYIWTVDYHFYFFDMSPKALEDNYGKLGKPIYVKYAALEYEFEFGLTLEGFNNAYFILQESS